MRALVPILVAMAVVGCDIIPRQEIASFAGAYADVDHAARAIYADYNARKSPSETAALAGVDPFTPAYITVLSDRLDDDRKDGPSLLEARYGALDAMLGYNDALVALAGGQRVEEIRSAMAPLALALVSAVGPIGEGASGAAGIVVGALDAARTREDLRAALAMTITVRDAGGRERSDHPTVLLLDLLDEDAQDIWIDVRADIEAQFTGIWTAMGAQPDPAALARAKAVVDAGRAYANTLAGYRELIAGARSYFLALRQGALRQSDVLRSAQFTALALELRAEARSLIDRL